MYFSIFGWALRVYVSGPHDVQIYQVQEKACVLIADTLFCYDKKNDLKKRDSMDKLDDEDEQYCQA